MVGSIRTFLFVAIVLAVAVSATQAEPLRQIKITSDRAPDCSSLKSIVADVTRGCKTDDERVIAIYNFCRYAYYHHAYPRESGGISTLKLINVYGWGLCGGQHTVMASLWEAAGYQWRYRSWRGHTTVEVYYGGRWHYLDSFLKFYTWMPDPNSPIGRTIAGQEDIKAFNDPFRQAMIFDSDRKVWYRKENRFARRGEEVNALAPAFLVCGDSLDGVFSGVDTNRGSGSPRGWGGIRFDGPDYSTDVDLAPGYSLTLDWRTYGEDAWYFMGSKQSPRHTCGDKDYRNCPSIGPILEPYREMNPARTWSNGALTFIPSLSDASCLDSFLHVENVEFRNGTLVPKDPSQSGVLVARMASPYVIVEASIVSKCGSQKFYISTDGKAFTKVFQGEPIKLVAGKYWYDVRIVFNEPISALLLQSIVQHNQESLPYLAPGNNKITISAANPEALGRNKLVVTYAYCKGSRTATTEEIYQRGAELHRAHYASWSDRPIVVQKVIDRLPATIDIPIGTPKDEQPVYPRMLFIRREILPPGQKLSPTLVPPTTPRLGAGERLVTAPNPWTVGTIPPPPMPEHPTDTTVHAPTAVSYVSKQGEIFEHQFVKWLKDSSDAWVLLAAFDPAKLPASKDFSSAKLVFYVNESHNKAPMQVGVVTLAAPFEPGKPYDFSKLAKMVGTTIVAQGNGPGDPFVPPKRYEIDISEQVRRWIGGERPASVALRIIPNRAVDDGWTVRFTPEKSKPVELEIATFSK